MAFSDFDLRRALETFGLQDDGDTDLFADVAPMEPSEFLRTWLNDFGPVARGVNSELARTTLIIAPLLGEVRRRSPVPSNFLPGVTLDVDRSRGLYGYCDYLLVRSAEYFFLRGPLVAVVEAKREDIIGGLGQCAAAMVALREFNEKDGAPVPAVYGCVTSGTVWQFLRLRESQLSIDRQEYYLGDVGKIVGILVHILGTASQV